MAQNFKETAHLNVDKEKFDNNYAKIFNKNDQESIPETSKYDIKTLLLRIRALEAEIEILREYEWKYKDLCK